MTSGHALPRSSLLANPVDRACRTSAAAAPLNAAAGAVAIAVAAAGVTLLLRRLAGGFSTVPMAAIPWSVAAGGIPLLLAVEAAARLGGARWPAWLARGGLVAAALAAAPVTGIMGWPARAAGLAGTAVALIAALRPPPGWRPPRLQGFRAARRHGDHPRASPGADSGSLADDPPPSWPPSGEPPAGPGPGQSRGAYWSAELPAGCRQRLERYETPAGEDCVRGQVMLSVAAGSRAGHAHVGFCPSFATLPAVEVTTHCDFVEAEVAAAEVLPWGVRVECRLSEPAEEPLEIPVVIRACRPA